MNWKTELKVNDLRLCLKLRKGFTLDPLPKNIHFSGWYIFDWYIIGYYVKKNAVFLLKF